MYDVDPHEVKTFYLAIDAIDFFARCAHVADCSFEELDHLAAFFVEALLHFSRIDRSFFDFSHFLHNIYKLKINNSKINSTRFALLEARRENERFDLKAAATLQGLFGVSNI